MRFAFHYATAVVVVDKFIECNIKRKLNYYCRAFCILTFFLALYLYFVRTFFCFFELTALSLESVPIPTPYRRVFKRQNPMMEFLLRVDEMITNSE